MKVGMLIERGWVDGACDPMLPWPLSRVVEALLGLFMRHDPTNLVDMSGSTFISSVGMFAKGQAGWGVSATPHSLSLFAGGIAWKPAVVAGRIEPREILDLTVLFDHDVIDGAPATRLVRRLVELIESVHGLASAFPMQTPPKEARRQ